VHAGGSSTTEPLTLIVFHAGTSQKAFEIHKHILTTKATFFREKLAHGREMTVEERTHPDIDEFGFALFVRWLYGGQLHGPKDFHTFHHYLTLYILSKRFEIEELSNTVMDLVRAYYRFGSMTAPAFRIEYIYTFTKGPDHMRNFLTTTAAYRALCEQPEGPNEWLTDSMQDMIGKGGEIAIDFAQALIKLSKNGIVDVRRGSNYVFHVHSDGR